MTIIYDCKGLFNQILSQTNVPDSKQVMHLYTRSKETGPPSQKELIKFGYHTTAKEESPLTKVEAVATLSELVEVKRDSPNEVQNDMIDAEEKPQ